MAADSKHTPINVKTFLFAFVIGAGYWFAETLIHNLIRHQLFFESLFPAEPHELWMRSYITCLLMTCWLYVKLLTNRRQEYADINRKSITINRRTVLTASVIALLYWFLEGTIGSAILPDMPLLRSLFPVDLHELWMRSFALCLIVIFSIYIHSAIDMLQESRTSLQAEKNKLQATIDAMHNGLTIQNPDYEIIYQNQVLIDIFGNRIGEKCYRVYEGNDKVCDGCPVKMAFEDSKSHTVVREVVMPSGEIAFWENTANPIRDAHGKIISCLEIANDITERKQSEEKEKKRQTELFHMSRMTTIGEMASGLAHELNQPLCAAINYTNACLHRLGRGNADTDKLIESMKASVKQTERAGEIINSIKNFVKKHESYKSTVDINNLIKRLPDFIAADISHSKVSLNLSLAEQIPVVLADHIQIEQVLLNLILNGIEAMADIETGKRQLNIQTSSTGQGVEIAVSDTGNGIPDEICDKIFNSFFTTKPDGMGIGLSISKTIVEAHNGRIWIDRSTDCGSTFRFTLPVAGAIS